MGRGRPGGNPEIKKYGFKQKYDWDEPCTAKLTLRLPPSQYAKLKELENWQEKLRKAIFEIVEEPQEEKTEIVSQS